MLLSAYVTVPNVLSLTFGGLAAFPCRPQTIDKGRVSCGAALSLVSFCVRVAIVRSTRRTVSDVTWADLRAFYCVCFNVPLSHRCISSRKRLQQRQKQHSRGQPPPLQVKLFVHSPNRLPSGVAMDLSIASHRSCCRVNFFRALMCLPSVLGFLSQDGFKHQW